MNDPLQRLPTPLTLSAKPTSVLIRGQSLPAIIEPLSRARQLALDEALERRLGQR